MNEHTVITGKIHSLETFGLVDGPGVRCVVFLQGCHMRCRYCHNPETWSMQGGEDSTAEEMFRKVYRYRNYWGKDGGLTVSGGEPLLQLDFVTEFFRLAKEKKVNTALDTSGNPFLMTPEYLEKFDRLMELTDLFLLDIKAVDAKLHKELTGQPNDNILAMAHYLADHGKSMWIRHVLVPGVTDDESDLQKLSDFVASLKTVQRFEVLPYHTLGVFKWEELGLDYALKDVNPPSKEEIERAETILKTAEYTGYKNK